MRTRLVVIASATAVLASAPGASAATIQVTNGPCYQETQEVVLKGDGFAPNATVSISREGKTIGTAAAKADGTFVGKFATTELPAGTPREQLFDLAATDGSVTAITRFRVTKVFADFAPGKGNPATLRVRFSINGFGLLKKHAPVYLHYVHPSGKLARTIKLGNVTGTCGKIDKTRLHRLFPFSAEKGTWVLQFDTNSKYVKAKQSSPFVWVRKPVQVFRRSGT